MLFRHKKSNVLYRMMFVSFNAVTQRQDVVYMSMDSGVIFNKDAKRFYAGMEHESNPQEAVEPNEDQAELKFDE